MEKILYLAHTQADGTLPKSAAEALNAAVEISKKIPGSTLTAGLVGEGLEKISGFLAGAGAVKVFAVSGPDFSMSRYGSDAAAIEAIVRASQATLVIAAATSRFSRTLPGVVSRFKGKIDTHVSGFSAEGGRLTVDRWYYRQRMAATLTRASRPWFLLVDSGVFSPFPCAGGSVALERLDVTLSESCKRTRVTGIESPASGAETIRPDAELLFVAGAGWTKKQSDGKIHIKDAEKTILDFIQAAKASLGSSKSLVDQSTEGEAILPFMSHLNQVGQTGTTPRHPKGLATCCHGEEPHVVGWRFINDRRAVNLDPNCGWAQGKADVLYVADAFQVMEKVNQLLASEKAVKV